MGEKALVKRDIHEGARLIQALIDDHFSVTAALWISPHDSDEWQLAIAMPMSNRTSRTAAYRLIQKELMSLGLDLPLSRIRLISDDDPSIQNLRSLVEADTSGRTALKVSISEAFGQSLDQGYIYALGPLKYEREVLSALQRMSDLGRMYEARAFLSNDAPGVDAIFATERRIVLVEIKALKKPVDQALIARTVALYNPARELFPRPVAFLIISRSGFSAAAYDYAAIQAIKIGLAQWMGPEDDPALQVAVSMLLSD
ncbi:hypothetical protein JOL79_30985 [Microbispora sp. RL4-1S]|uniref:Uncharacterized protein n=1 Tax=Microbispora oryzae TaxID=2806554 RepID=A0A940WM62_9ACTN|nr:hypothetical protein [Microbispora oryzae]MBP2708214.1 hypothetical protein [Microbispora oryzae]